MTRTEHLEWAKQRALEYLPHDPNNAFASIMSDLRNHPGTMDHPGIIVGAQLMMGGQLSTPDGMRQFIEGFT